MFVALILYILVTLVLILRLRQINCDGIGCMGLFFIIPIPMISFGFIIGVIRISSIVRLVIWLVAVFITILIYVTEDILTFGIYYSEGSIDYSRYEFNFNMILWSFVGSFVLGQIVFCIHNKIKKLKNKS